MATDILRDRLFDGETLVGTFQISGSPMVAETLGETGMDFVILDQEHGPLTAETSASLTMGLDNTDTASVVRVRENSKPEIQRALDIGAQGVQIPQIETLEDAQEAAAAANFSPIGERGLSQYVRAGDYVGSDTYTDDQNERTTVIIHVEGQRGVDNIEDILSVEGIDVIFLGPYDLSQSLGIPGQVRDERVEELMSEVAEKAEEAGRVVGTFADDPEMARRWMDAGVQYIAMYVELPFLHDAADEAYRQAFEQ
ncbi:MAG: HpcH/HpaI aldolase/citrate lyase family protein [Haloarculaceae archaeon]